MGKQMERVLASARGLCQYKWLARSFEELKCATNCPHPRSNEATAVLELKSQMDYLLPEDQ